MKTEFIQPRLVGGRFDDHSIPVEVLKDWAAFEGLVVETAKWLYLEDNQRRKRVPRGFTEGFALHLSGVLEGSAVAKIDRISNLNDLFPDVFAQWFDLARDTIIATIAAASNGAKAEVLLPKHLLAYFDKFGRSLRETEKVEFIDINGTPVTYDPRVRKALVLRASSEYRTEELIRGSIYEVDVEKCTLMFRLASGGKVSASYAPEVRGQAVEALANYGDGLVLIECVVVRDQSDGIRTLENISRIDPLDPLDVIARIQNLATLRDGWLDGQGQALSREGLSWFAQEWQAHWPQASSLPCLYPTPEGGLQAEWDTGSKLVEAVIDLQDRSADLLIVDKDNGDVSAERKLDLKVPDGWTEIINSVTGTAIANERE